MCSIKAILLGFLILGVCQTVLSKPSSPSPDQGKEEADDYPGDDDYQYPDEEDENKSGQTIKEDNNKEDNSVHRAPPYFDNNEYDKTAKIDENIELECGAKNIAEGNVIMWYNQSLHITQDKYVTSTDSRVSIDDNYTLKIRSVRKSDAGQYFCKVLPNEITRKVNLVVENVPTAIILDKEGRNISGRQMTYHQGDRIEIECRGYGNPTPQIKWFSKGERVVSGMNSVHVNNGFLIIDHADHDHVKLYQCLADNGVTVGHATFSINVQYSPKMNVHRHIVNTKEGDDAELHCNYKSTTPSKVTWRKSKEQLQVSNQDKYSTFNETKDEHHESSVLIIKNVDRNDLGDYECEVQNTIGKGHVKIHLGYEPEPPKFDRMEIVGDTITTHWVIRSLQPLNEVMLNYQKSGDRNWLSEKPIHSEKSKEHSGIWRIQHKLSLDSGTWNARVKAKNADGWSLYSEQEKIVVHPKLNEDEDDFEREIPEEAVIQKAGITGSSTASIYQLSSAVCLVSLLLATIRI